MQILDYTKTGRDQIMLGVEDLSGGPRNVF